MSPAEDPAVEHDVQRTILVVEDEVLPRLAISEYLRGCGFHVVEAADGAEAQQLLLTGLEVDLVFSDISMPGEVDGVALAAWIGANNIPTEIILTSGLASALASARAACAHVKGFVSKPYDYQLVADRIRTMLTA
jgi:CheY-like chemotaxis protein